MRKIPLVLTFTGLLASLAACVDKGPAQQSDPTYVRQNLLPAAPTPKTAVNADLGGKVVYLGADLDKDTVKPGEKLTIIHYWKVVQAPGSDYRIFTHVNGTSGKDWMNVDSTKMRGQYGPEKWKAGDIVKDEQVLSLKGDWTSPTATIYVGMYRKGGQSEGDRMPVVSGPSDGHSRVKVATVNVAIAGGTTATPAAAAAPKAFVIKRASGPITIDGKADEPAWADAVSTGPFKDAEGGPVLGQPTMARMLYDDKNLYLFVDVSDTDVYSQYTKNDDPLWKEDVVEIFIDADNNRRGYVELQVNPNNAQFDSWWAGTRAGPPGDEKWNAGMTTAVVVEGTKDNRNDVDKAWHAEIAIPLEAVKGRDTAMAVRLPPQPGDTWHMNLVRGEKAQGKGLAASSWASITIQDFHAIDRLNAVVFGDEKGNTGAAPAVPAAPGAPTAPTSAPTIAPTKAVAPTGTPAAPAPAPAPTKSAPTKPATK